MNPEPLTTTEAILRSFEELETEQTGNISIKTILVTIIM